MEESLCLDKIRNTDFTIENHPGISANKYTFLENQHIPIPFYILEDYIKHWAIIMKNK